jgi:hypothetical protein
MSVVLQFTSDNEALALPILLRHSPGTILANHTYVVDDAAANALRDAGIVFREVAPTVNMPFAQDSSVGERI